MKFTEIFEAAAKKAPKTRSPAAASLADRKYQQKIIPNKKKKTDPKHKKKTELHENDQGFHVIDHKVYGKVLGHNGQIVVTDGDTASHLADQFNATGIFKSMDGRRYIIKMSEAPPEAVNEFKDAGRTAGKIVGTVLGTEFGPVGRVAGGAVGGYMGNHAQERLQDAYVTLKRMIDHLKARKQKKSEFQNQPDEHYSDIEDVTTKAGGGLNGPKHPRDLRGNSFPIYPEGTKNV